MDQLTSQKPEILELIRHSALSRTILAEEFIRAKERFDVPARVRGNFQNHTGTWLLGSGVLGLAASLFFGRPSRRKSGKNTEGVITKTAKTGGKYGILAGLLMAAAKPLARMWLEKRVRYWIGGGVPMPASQAVQGLPTTRSRTVTY